MEAAKSIGKAIGIAGLSLTLGGMLASLAYWTGNLNGRVVRAEEGAIEATGKLELLSPTIEKNMQFRTDAVGKLASIEDRMTRIERNVLILCLRSGVDCERQR